MHKGQPLPAAQREAIKQWIAEGANWPTALSLTSSGAAAKKDEHARMALASYERAVELDATAPEPHRQLGFLYYQQKDTVKAKAAFEKYLALKPGASDARRIKEYLVELDR